MVDHRRIVVHDYSGHGFQIQLSRWLAARGNTVLHLYSADMETPRGRLVWRADDPAGLVIEPVSTGRPLPKYALIRRWFQEAAFGRALTRRVRDFQPDVVLSANAPPAVQARLLAGLERQQIPLVCWVQDIYTIAAETVLRSWPWPLDTLLPAWLGRIEFATMRRAAGLIAISPDFIDILARRGVRHSLSATIENWAPAGEIEAGPKDNDWSRSHGLAEGFCFLYSGTLGLKHNPARLVELALAFRDDCAVRVVVVSQGLGRAWLEEEKRRLGLDRLILLDFQPAEILSRVLASADVTVVLLEAFAGALSVPSKVYSSFCARRPLLAAIPPTNLAARLIAATEAGLCAAPDDADGFLASARRLRADAELRRRMSENQEAYAAQAFDMEVIGPRFLRVLDRARAEYRRPRSSPRRPA
jgi:colanic acid biosynthesis glycosyl transferase WcaI